MYQKKLIIVQNTQSTHDGWCLVCISYFDIIGLSFLLSITILKIYMASVYVTEDVSRDIRMLEDISGNREIYQIMTLKAFC